MADLAAISAILNETPATETHEPTLDSRRNAKTKAAAKQSGAPASTEPGSVKPAPATPELGEPSADALDEIERLMGSESDAPDVAGDPQTDDVTPASLKALAEKLGVEPADLYALTIPLGGDGETMTLGQLKDMAKEAGDLNVARMQLDEQVEAQRVATRRDREDLENLVSMIPREMLTQAMIERARSAGEEYKTEQGRLLNELVPEWRDTASYTADRGEILEHVKKHGWTEDDLNGVYDARLLAYFRRQAKREARTTQLLEKMKSASSIGRGFKANATAKARAESARAQTVARTGSRGQQITEIDKLLKG